MLFDEPTRGIDVGAKFEIYKLMAQLAAQGNGTLVVNIGSLSDAMGKTSTAAASVLTASTDLTATAETLSREVDKFFHNLRADPLERQGGESRRMAAAG